MTNKVSVWQVVKYGIKTIWKTMPVMFVALNVFAVGRGLSFGFMAFATQVFFDSVSDVINNGYSSNHAYVAVVFVIIVMLLSHVALGMHYFLWFVSFQKIHGEMRRLVHNKMAKIDPIYLEDTKLHDDINKAMRGSEKVVYIVIMSLTLFTFYIPYFIFMGFFLHHLNPNLIFAIVIVFIPTFVSQLLRTGIISKFEDKAAPIRREFDYYKTTITNREYFKETRMLGAYPFFMGNIFSSLKKLQKAEWSKFLKTSALEMIISLLSAAGYIVVLIMLVRALLAGEITAGAFAAVFASIAMLFGMMDRMVNGHIKNMMADMGLAHNFIRFMKMPERGGEDRRSDFSKGIVAENISFTYPHAKHVSVNNVSIEIKAGETIAIVGENGAGKTTLVRLLTGLYTPSGGSVSINGMDTVRTKTQNLFENITGVFQRYQRYQMTLADNVKISRTGNEESIETVIKEAGIDIDKATFPNGEETMLSREFDGVDLSGGQWQRVAIARGLYRAHDVVVLDEPTAAIDPIEESKIYHKFIDISKDKTAIIVTHRLGSAKIADRIVVMDKGEIVDLGTHNELMKKNGLYTDMFNSQAGWYEK